MKDIPQYRIARVSAKVIFFIGAMFFALSILAFLIKITEKSIFSDSLFFLGTAFNALLLIVGGQLILSVLDNAEHKARMLALMQEIYHIDVEREYASSVFFLLARKFFINLINPVATITRYITSLIFILIVLVGILYYIPEFYQKKEIMWLIIWVALVIILTIIPEKLNNKVKWQHALSKYYWWVRLGVATIAVTIVLFSFESIHAIQIPENITTNSDISTSDLKKIYENTWGKQDESYDIYPFYVSPTYIYTLIYDIYTGKEITEKIKYYDPIITRSSAGTIIYWKFKLKLNNKQYKFPADDSGDPHELYFLKYEKISVPAGDFECIVAKIKGIEDLTMWMVIDKPGIYAKATHGRTTYELDSLRKKPNFFINVIFDSLFKIMNGIYKISKWIKSYF